MHNISQVLKISLEDTLFFYDIEKNIDEKGIRILEECLVTFFCTLKEKEKDTAI